MYVVKNEDVAMDMLQETYMEMNSVSVDKEVVKFVIYHECLHQEFVGHPKEFRAKERSYKDFQKL